jgi:DNA-binding CsgD family transcriptional regulator
VSNPLSSRERNRVSLLTPRERQVHSWLARGATNRRIGTALGVSPRTVEKHIERILAKLGVKNRTRAALLAKEVGRDQAHKTFLLAVGSYVIHSVSYVSNVELPTPVRRSTYCEPSVKGKG